MSTTDSKSLRTDLPADASAEPSSSPNERALLSHDKRTKKRAHASSRRKFLGQAGGATAAVLAASAIGLEPLIGSRRSTARAVELSPFTGDRTARANEAAQIRID